MKQEANEENGKKLGKLFKNLIDINFDSIRGKTVVTEDNTQRFSRS